MVLWLVPVVSVITCMSIYGLALGMDIDIGVIVNIMVGIMFIILGNYVHKVKQNYTVGMKLPWTLNSEENWNRTNRMTGWILILSGLLFLMNSLLLKTEIVFAVILLVILVPMIYSFILIKRESEKIISDRHCQKKGSGGFFFYQKIMFKQSGT